MLCPPRAQKTAWHLLPIEKTNDVLRYGIPFLDQRSFLMSKSCTALERTRLPSSANKCSVGFTSGHGRTDARRRQWKKCNRKVQGGPQSQATAIPDTEEEETDKTKQAQIEHTNKKH